MKKKTAHRLKERERKREAKKLTLRNNALKKLNKALKKEIAQMKSRKVINRLWKQETRKRRKNDNVVKEQAAQIQKLQERIKEQQRQGRKTNNTDGFPVLNGCVMCYRKWRQEDSDGDGWISCEICQGWWCPDCADLGTITEQHEPTCAGHIMETVDEARGQHKKATGTDTDTELLDLTSLLTDDQNLSAESSLFKASGPAPRASASRASSSSQSSLTCSDQHVFSDTAASCSSSTTSLHPSPPTGARPASLSDAELLASLQQLGKRREPVSGSETGENPFQRQGGALKKRRRKKIVKNTD